MGNRLLHAIGCLSIISGLNGVVYAESESSQPSQQRMTPFVRFIQRACDSTVNIHTEKRQKSLDVVFNSGKSSNKVNGMGTGLLIDERGFILTNNHVIQDVESIRVTRNNGESYIGTVFQTDPKNDLAIIRIHPRGPVPVIPIGTSSDLMLGEDVIAIGNAYGYEHSVTRGIVSALGRNVEAGDDQVYENLIQTDAAINPGNSGGPLLNSEGDVIGINVAIRAGASMIGFAIPIDAARTAAARMMSAEKTANVSHGAVLKDHKVGTTRRLTVQSVRPNSPAALAGLQQGDVIVRSGSMTIVDAVDFERSFLDRKANDQLDIVVTRDGVEQTLGMRLVAAGPESNNPVRNYVANSAPRAAVTTPAATLRGDKAWELLGLRMTSLNKGDNRLEGLAYSGGMVVGEVRKDSPAAQSGIRQGDILVGLSSYETVKDNDVHWVLTNNDLRGSTPLKFYVVRDRDTLYGYFSGGRSERTASAK